MQDTLAWLNARDTALAASVAALVALVIGVALALVAHRLAMSLLRRAVSRSKSSVDDVLLRRAGPPSRWIAIAIGASLAQRAAPLSPWMSEFWRQAAGFILPALVGWLAVSLIGAFKDIVDLRADITVEDNLAARRKRTRVGILARVAVILVLFLTVCMMLLSIPGVRNVGVTLMASAGLAGLAVGAAAQPALKNLIAGVQMAFTEPIRIDDVVIIAGEWGRIEEIRLTYVVVRIWDERRLVVPVSKFLEEPFQNWTRESSQLLGSAFLYVDPAADVPRMREHVEKVVRAQPLWDGRFFNLQVTDIKPDVMEIRILATAANAGQAFDLRCAIREEMIAFVAGQMPEALPRHRLAPGKDGETEARRAA